MIRKQTACVVEVISQYKTQWTEQNKGETITYERKICGQSPYGQVH